SSSRRHTIFSRDWSSDVCSSDLVLDSGSREALRELNVSLSNVPDIVDAPTPAQRFVALFDILSSSLFTLDNEGHVDLLNNALARSEARREGHAGGARRT